MQMLILGLQSASSHYLCENRHLYKVLSKKFTASIYPAFKKWQRLKRPASCCLFQVKKSKCWQTLILKIVKTALAFHFSDAAQRQTPI